jgi:hypothetical protein
MRRYKRASEIGLYLYVGRSFVEATVELAVEDLGKTYNEALIQGITTEVLGHPDILEELLAEEWADTAVVQWDGSDRVHGTIDYEGEETELTAEDVSNLEQVVGDFVSAFVDDAIDRADIDDLIWIPVDSSSNVESFAYDFNNRFMYVRFLDKGYGGSLYVYEGVEAEIYNQFLMAPSKGKAVWQLLRDRYDYHRLQ